MIKSETITLTTRIAQTEGNIVSDMGEEKVMLSVKNGKYYNLGETGGVIWDLLDQPKTVNEMILLLVEKFNVEYEDCVNQVLTFVEQLFNQGLVKVEKGN